MPCRSAYTLVELVLVLAISAVLTAIALPRIARTDERTRLVAAAGRVCREFSRAREWAACTGRGVTLSADPSGLTVTGVQSERHAGDRRVELAGVPYGVSILAMKLGGDDSIAIDGRGLPDSEGELILGTEHYIVSIAIDAGSGAAVAAEVGARPPAMTEVGPGGGSEAAK